MHFLYSVFTVSNILQINGYRALTLGLKRQAHGAISPLPQYVFVVWHLGTGIMFHL